MSLIQPTTLLLLMAMHCGTGSPQGGNSAGIGIPEASLTPEQKCVFQKCKNVIDICLKDPACKATAMCGVKALGDITKTFNCGMDTRARDIRQCGVKVGCYKLKETCSKKLGLGVNNPKVPNLVQLMSQSFWKAVMSDDKKPENFLSFPCTKLGIFGSKETPNGVGVGISVCGGNKTGGGCVTPYLNFFGQGYQIGESGAIKVKMNGGPFVISPAYMYMDVVGATNGFAVVRGCYSDPSFQFESNTYTVFSPYNTYQEALDNSQNSRKERRALKKVLARLGKDLSQFHKIDASLCKN